MGVQDEFGLGGPCRLDAYRATVYADNQEVIQDLKARFRSCTEWIMEGNKVGNYGMLLRGRAREDQLQVKWGGEQPYPLVESKSGPQAPDIALFCGQWPHRVTRADAKIDVQGVGAYDDVVAIIEAIRKRQRIVPAAAEYRDMDGVKGRSMYYGSKQSEFGVVVYEKSLQLLHVKGNVVPPNIVRIEARYRPNSKEAGIAASKLKPVDYFGVSGWGREVYEAVSGEAIEAVHVPRNGASSLDHSLVSMMAQFGKNMELLAEREGGWCQAGLFLEHLLPEGQELLRQRMSAQRQRNEVVKSS